MAKLTITKVLSGIIVLALVATGVLLVLPHTPERHLTATFPRTVSLYTGSDVRILGVTVGKVDSVTPKGTGVQVKMHYDSEHPVPANAKAVLVSPSIVGDRFIQLTPVYEGGAKLADNAVLSEKRTAVPLELDQIYGSLNDLSVALGPDGANTPDERGVGALTRILRSTAANFDGEGAEFNQTLNNVSDLTSTLDGSKEQLFGTVDQVEAFVKTLSKNDTTVRQFNDALAQGADLLAGERKDLAAALQNLSVALVAVRGFVQDNRTQLTQNIGKLNQLATTLVKRRDEVDEILSDAPVALNNLGLAYNPKVGTLDTRSNLTENLGNPALTICTLIGTTQLSTKQCQDLLKGLGLNRAAPLQDNSKLADRERYVDRSLAGLAVPSR